MKKRDPIILIVVAVVISLMLVFGIQKTRHTSIQQLGAGQFQGKEAPDFTLTSLDGKTLKLSDFRGKAVLLNFWATWCEPCKIEMPWFVDLQKKYAAQGFTVLGVAMDDSSPSDIADFAKKMGVNYPIVIGKEAVGEQYGGVNFMPSSFYIDRDGKVLDRVIGLVSRSEIETNVQKAMAQGQVAQK